MKKIISADRDWSTMDYDLLVRIFMTLSVVDLSAVSTVCKAWHQAWKDPELQNKNLDLSILSYEPYNIPKKLDVRYDKKSSARMSLLLRNALIQTKGKLSCLIFNFYVGIRDVHLITAARRTPNLKRLVLPGSGHLSKAAVYHAMRVWKGLESITITSGLNNPYIFTAIGKYCKNLSELKITFAFEVDHAAALIQHTPNLKVLSLRRMLVNMTALCNVLNGLQHLEVVNICHSAIMDRPKSILVLYQIRELHNHLNDSCLKKLIFCLGKTCIRCKGKGSRIRNQEEGEFDFLEEIWRDDEISSLAH